MLKRKFAGLAMAGLLLGTGMAQAAESAFPSAARELGDYEIAAKNAKEGIPSNAKLGFPSAAIEGYEFAAEHYAQAAPRNLDRMIGSMSVDSFPSSALEFSHI